MMKCHELWPDYMHLSSAFLFYLIAWVLLCVFAVASFLRDKTLCAMVPPYLNYLFQPWKVALFAPAGLFVTFAGQFAWDDSWDVVTGAGMSILTFLTAPFAAGLMFKVLQGAAPARHWVIAVTVGMFSASWFYDGWLLLRDGHYSAMWLPNLLLSPFLYALAGLLWNLEVDGQGNASLGFMRADWPKSAGRRLNWKLLLAVLPAVFLTASILLFSVHWRM
jgi:hypothetical protein